MDIYVLTKNFQTALDEHCSNSFAVLGMTCYNFGDDIKKVAGLLALAAGNLKLEKDFLNFLRESRQIYFDGFLKVVTK